VIQSASEELIGELLSDLTDRIFQIMRSNTFKAQTPILETLVSLIFHVETMIAPYYERLLEVILEQIRVDENRKVAIDGLYALTAILKEQIVPNRLQILQVLMPYRYNKVKPVREATLETIKLLKETGPQLARLEERPIKTPSRLQASKSPGRGGAVTAPLISARSTNTAHNSSTHV
jgi:hypothetical protein